MLIEKVPVKKLNPAAYNPRKNLQPGDPEYEKLVRSIDEFGYVEPIVWNKRTGNVVGGHQRLKVMMAKGHKIVEVSVVDLEPSREKALNVALNKIGGDWDVLGLDKLLSELKSDGFDVTLTGFDDKELTKLYREADELGKGDVEEDDIPPVPKTPTTKRGDLYGMGDHRLLCGDSTDEKDVARLFDGAKADMVLTDPPYGVAYVGGTKDALEIENDALDEAGLSALVKGAFDLAQKNSRGGGILVCNGPAGTVTSYIRARPEAARRSSPNPRVGQGLNGVRALRVPLSP